jgi:hypothetical protein
MIKQKSRTSTKQAEPSYTIQGTNIRMMQSNVVEYT